MKTAGGACVKDIYALLARILPLAEEDCLIWLPDLEIRDVYVLAGDGPTIKITMGKAVKYFFS